LPQGDDVKSKLLAVPMKSMKRVAQLSLHALLAALVLTLATPSSSRLAIEQPHVGLGAFLAERDHVYLVDNMKFDWVVWQLQWSLAEPSKGNYQWLGLEMQPADRPSFEARVEHIVPLLEVPRFEVGEVIQVEYDPQDKTKVAIV